MSLSVVEKYVKWMFLPDDSIVSCLDTIVLSSTSESASGPSYILSDD